MADADDSNNPRSRSVYNAAGELIESVDETGAKTTYEYDGAGRRTKTILTPVNGAGTLTDEYDSTGRRTASVDAEGHRSEYRYDAAGRLIETLHEGASTSVEYDAVGRKVAEIDATGRRSGFGYDALGRLTSVTLAAGTPSATLTRYRYDEQGNKIEQIDATGQTTRWEYDAMGREIARILPEGQRETKQYNAAGELIAQTDFKGKTTRYRYDVTGRAEAIDYATDADVGFGYNAAGERTAVTDGRGTSTMAFDRRSRVVQSRDADGGLIEYSYDAVGNLLSRVSASQSLVYRYDARHRLTQVTRTVDGELPTVTRYEYDQDGNRKAMLGGDGTRTEYTYDRRHRLTDLVKKTAAGALLLAMQYTVDASGMRTAVAEADASGPVRAVAYTYDPLKRLTQEAIDHRDDAKDRVTAWTYDPVGNRLTQTLTTGGTTETTAYRYDRNDRLLDEVRTGGAAAGSTAYAYDANGNTLRKTAPSGVTTYAYDDANRLIEATPPQGTTVYVYNADGLRVRQTHTPAGGTATTTWYVQDSAYPYAQVMEEYTSTPTTPKTLAATFTFADDLVSQTRYTGSAGALTPTTQFIQTDGFGSTRWLTNAAGAITDKVDYDAFGVEIGRTGTTPVEHLYRGERFDAGLAMYDLRARLYFPGNGRFLTQDTFAGFSMDPQSLHKYAYTSANPVNLVDPSGHFGMADAMTSLKVAGHMLAWGIPTYNAIGNLQAGKSLGETSMRFAAEVAIGYAGGAVLGRLTRFLPPIIRIRSAGSLLPAGGRSAQSMWNLGVNPRGAAAELAVLGGQRTLPWNYPVIDDFAGGFATSIKSMDLIGKSSSYIRSQMLAAAEKLAAFVPRNYGAAGQLRGATVNGRNLIYVFEPGAADAAQAVLLKQIAQEIKAAYPEVKLAFQWVP